MLSAAGSALAPLLALWAGSMAMPSGDLRAEEAAPGSSSAWTDDAAVERALRHGKVERMEALQIGVSHPTRVWLSFEGAHLSAAFKTIDIVKHGLSRKEDRTTEVNFSDRYHYDVAAFLLSRELGLDFVPVTIERKIRNRRGALVFWIEDSITESERAESRLVPPDVESWQRQLSLMHLFDALIANDDRNPGNILYTADWRVVLIDHTRAFRRATDLIEKFADRPARLPPDLLERLEALERQRLRRLLKNWITGRQIDRMLQRRDRILEKVAADRARLGDEAVLVEP
jgi:hypothetical protein